ncbi:MAG: ornithine cyclodeaminase family protein [Alphaproteobacteria bacterium]|nr:ornithine cyclodeaminase family protein [Alphaproteobacteria bacterium]
MEPINITWLGGPDVERLDMTNDEILGAIETALRGQGEGKTVIHPRMHLMPGERFRGHFNVLRGFVGNLDYKGVEGLAGVKVVGDFVDNYRHGLRSEMAILYLADPRTGTPLALVDASDITDMRTGAVTAIGGKYLARKNSKILGHIGARGSSYWNVRLLDHLFDFSEIRVHSRRKESRDAFGAKLTRDLGKKIIVTEDWESCIKGADIVVEASRLTKPEPLLKTAWIKKGAFVCPYGTMSALELSLTDIMDKMLMDDWGQAHAGPLGALRAHVEAGKLSEKTLHAELGQVVAGIKPGRERDDETILLWHRGLSLSDIALGHAFLAKAQKLGLGQQLRFA